jgi:hypothetical protein
MSFWRFTFSTLTPYHVALGRIGPKGGWLRGTTSPAALKHLARRGALRSARELAYREGWAMSCLAFEDLALNSAHH